MSELRTKQQLILLETFSQDMLKARTADEVAEILLNTVFEAFPGFDEGYVFLPDGKGGFRPVMQRKGLEVSRPSESLKCLLDSTWPLAKASRREGPFDGNILAPDEGDDKGAVRFLDGVTPPPCRFGFSVEEHGVLHGWLELSGSGEAVKVWGNDGMQDFLDIAGSALSRIATSP